MVVSENNAIWCAVVNVFAASKKAGSLWGKAERMLKDSGVSFDCVKTGEDGNVMSLACASCEKGYRKFIAVGGDGTVHDVLEGIMLFIESRRLAGEDVSVSDFTLAVIPVGSGNDWIKTAGIPADIPKAVSLFTEGQISRQDVVKVSMLDPESLADGKVLKVSYMANVGGVGLDAKVCYRVNRDKCQGKRGKILYVKALLYNIFHRAPSFVRVFCDGKEVFDGSFLSIAFGIGKYSGGGMRQTPEAVMDDGLLDMTVIPDISMMVIAKEAYKLFTGKFLTIRQVVSARGRVFAVIPYDESLPCQAISGELTEVDGEVVGNAPVKLEVLEEQLNILTTKGPRSK